VSLELGHVVGARDHHRAARREQRVLREACGRVLQEGAACHGEGAHLRRAVAFHEERGRAAGGVVAGLRLALEQDHARMRGQPVGRRSPRDAAADHEEVGRDGSWVVEEVIGEKCRNKFADTQIKNAYQGETMVHRQGEICVNAICVYATSGPSHPGGRGSGAGGLAESACTTRERHA
jgi:hypothetical protein